MILKDYQCQICEEITEFLVDGKNIPDTRYCPICNGIADKIISMSHTAPIDSPWINSVLEVVDKSPDKPHCQEFLRHPNRANYKAWMKGEGLRPLEPGERAIPKSTREQRKAELKNGMLKRFRERNAISI